MQSNATRSILNYPPKTIRNMLVAAGLNNLSLRELDAQKRRIARELHTNVAAGSNHPLLRQLDLARGYKFMEKGSALEARQAFLEQIRVNTTLLQAIARKDTESEIGLVSQRCWDYVHIIEHEWKSYFSLPQAIEEAEAHFALVYHGVYRHTMLHWARLLNIWRKIRSLGMDHASQRAKCIAPHDKFFLTECGVAGGGCSVLMAVASSLYLTDAWGHQGSPPSVISVDNFIGMPCENASLDKRICDGAKPNECSWGEGTCGSAGQTVNMDHLADRFGVRDRILCVKGNFDAVLPGVFGTASPTRLSAPENPRLLFAHIDADWYDSTRTCMSHVYPNLVGRGIGSVQLDDYHYWEGCQRAVKEYFAAQGMQPKYEQIPHDANAVCITKW